MIVIGWIDDDEIEDGFITHFGGLGGFFKNGMRWKDYIDVLDEDEKLYAEALRRAVVDHDFRYTGDQHQNGPLGVPVFSDGTYASFSLRAWGDLMAAIWSEQEDVDYSYMDFYC